MAGLPNRSPWSDTFDQRLTVYQLLPFSLRVGFAWQDRTRLSEELARRLPTGSAIREQSFEGLGLRDLPESYRRRYSGWLQIIPPQHYVKDIDTRRHAIVKDFGAICPQPTGLPSVEILVTSSGLGTIRLVHDVEWGTCADLQGIHASQTAFIHSYFKTRARDLRLPDDLLPLLAPIREALLAMPNADGDPRHQLTRRFELTWPIVDFFVGLVVCDARSDAPDRPRWDELRAAQEIECITDQAVPVAPDCILSCEALLVMGWDESLLAFAGPPSPRREESRRNAVEFFTLGALHWTGLYDTDQLLYEALPFLFRRGRSYGKLQLIRGVQTHLAELQHESKVAYLAEHEDDRKILSRMFDVWETENLASNLEKKSTILTAIVGRLHDERLRDVGVIFTALGLMGIVSNLGQRRQWDDVGWMWSGVAFVIALIGWLVLLRLGRS